MDVSGTFLWLLRVGIALVFLSALLFLLGFATNYWHGDSQVNYGLWEKCQQGRCYSWEPESLPGYHTATQSFQLLATIFYALAPLIHALAYAAKKQKSNDCRTRIFDVGYSIGIVFHVVSVVVFGSLHSTPASLSWSFKMSASGTGFAVVGITLVIVSRKKALRFFHFLPSSIHKQRSSRIAEIVSNSSTRTGTPQSVSSGSSGQRKFVFSPQKPRATDLQNSVHVDTQNFTNESNPSFATSESQQMYPGSYRRTTPGPNKTLLRTLRVKIPAHYSGDGMYSPSLSNSNSPPTPATSELAPLRVTLLPPLLDSTPT